MDRNTYTGLFVIALILLGWSFFMKPSEAELKKYEKQTDSIEQVKKGIAPQAKKVEQPAIIVDSTATPNTKEEFITLENELIKVTLSTKGGRVYSTQLKQQKTWDGKPLMLFTGDENRFGLKLALNNRTLATNDAMFVAQQPSAKVTGKDSSSITLRLPFAANQYIDYVYSLKGNSYMVDFKIRMVGMDQLVTPTTKNINLEWQSNILQQEKDRKNEQNFTTVYYKTAEDKIDYLSETSDKEENIEQPLKWLSFKQHFFSSVLMADNSFASGKVKTETDLTKPYIKTLRADLSLPYSHKPTEEYGMKYYFGINHYQTLKEYGNDLEKQINLGWGPLKWINRYAVIPVFNWLDNFNMSYGIIILVLTLLLKVVLLPLTYKSYLAQAKMRIIQPEMNAIKEKIGEDDPTRLQQEYLKLYKQAGVNPLGGCVPLLLQMPILFAFFKFFPSSFELRQESFLWMKDLSTFDSVINLPFTIPFMGNHISLMCLLMTISTLMYTWMNNKISNVTGQMKYLGYIMPIMFLGALNSFPAGLNYYYFCANMLTFGQQWLIKKTVNEDAIHQQIQENKKRPAANKVSKWQKRLEEMAKQQKTMQQQRKK